MLLPFLATYYYLEPINELAVLSLQLLIQTEKESFTAWNGGPTRWKGSFPACSCKGEKQATQCCNSTVELRQGHSFLSLTVDPPTLSCPSHSWEVFAGSDITRWNFHAGFIWLHLWMLNNSFAYYISTAPCFATEIATTRLKQQSLVCVLHTTVYCNWDNIGNTVLKYLCLCSNSELIPHSYLNTQIRFILYNIFLHSRLREAVPET